MGNWAYMVGEELAVVDEEVRVLAWVHGFAVVVYEGLFCTWWGSGVPFDGVSPGGGKGVACGYPAVEFIFRGIVDVDESSRSSRIQRHLPQLIIGRQVWVIMR